MMLSKNSGPLKPTRRQEKNTTVFKQTDKEQRSEQQRFQVFLDPRLSKIVKSTVLSVTVAHFCFAFSFLKNASELCWW